MIDLLEQYALKGTNHFLFKRWKVYLNAMIFAFKLILSCKTLGPDERFYNKCFDNVYSKACWYVTSNEKVCKGLKYVFIKFWQVNLQKWIIWSKKFRKDRQEWNKTSIDSSFCSRKQKTLVKIWWNMAFFKFNDFCCIWIFKILRFVAIWNNNI